FRNEGDMPIGDMISTMRAAVSLAERMDNAEMLGTLNKTLLDMNELIVTNTELREAVQQLREQVKQLEQQLEFKGKLTRHKTAYFDIGEDGKPTGTPYCSRGWEVNHKAVHLTHLFGHHAANCPECNAAYDWTIMSPK